MIVIWLAFCTALVLWLAFINCEVVYHKRKMKRRYGVRNYEWLKKYMGQK